MWFNNSYATEISDASQPPHIPAIPPLAHQAERDSALYLACTVDNDPSPTRISVLDVFQTLQVNDTYKDTPMRLTFR